MSNTFLQIRTRALYTCGVRMGRAAVAAFLGSAFLGASLATPQLPSNTVASLAVKSALTPTAPARAAATVSAASAAALRAQGVRRAANLPAAPRVSTRSAVVHSTAYNSTPGQTDGSPFITATGTRVRPGVVALSRDLLARFPYGTRISIEDLSGRYSALLQGRVFIVEDTMHARIYNTVDVWMGSRGEALAWGSRNIRITALR